MLKCPKCGNRNLVGAKIVETGVVTKYEIVKNLRGALTDLVVVQVDCSTENEHSMMLECPKCKNSVSVEAELAGGYAIVTADSINNPPRKQSKVWHACGMCGLKCKEGALREIRDLFQRVAPGEPMPSGQCPHCGSLCHPSME